jgi:HEAT repeat protein
LTLLAFIWWLSLALAAGTLLTMAVLILRRLVTERREKSRAVRRRQLSRRLLSGDSPSAEELKNLPRGLAADTFVELMRLVRGSEREAFASQARALGVPWHLGRRLQRGSTRERLLAAQALGQFLDQDSTAILQTALTDRSPEVRLAAALALADAGHSHNVRDLIRELGLGVAEDSTLAVTLFRSLWNERPDEIKALVTEPDTNSRVRLAAVEALAMNGDYSLVPVITRLAIAASDDADELPGYLHALGLLAHPAARPAVLDGLSRSSYPVRAEAARAAGRIGVVEFAGQIASLLDDGEWWVRFRAAEALFRLGDPGVEWLRRQAREGSPRARNTAASMLAEYKVAP